MFGRVASLDDVSLNTAFFPEKIADISSNVATIKDLFDYESFETLVTTTGAEGFLFYNFNYISSVGSGTSSFPDSSSLVARISTQKKFGVQIDDAGIYVGQYSGTPALNVYEIEPTVSLLDIYYETSTSGTIDQLNTAVDEGVESAFAFIDGPVKWTLTEGATDLQDDFCGNFQPVRLDGNSFPNPSLNTCQLVSVEDGNGLDTDPVSGVKYFDSTNPSDGIFNITQGSILGTFKIILSKTPSGNDTPGLVFKTDSNGSNILPNNFIFTVDCQNPGTPETSTLSFQRALRNVLPPTPTVLSDKNLPTPNVDLCVPFPVPSPAVNVLTVPSSFNGQGSSVIATINSTNGSSTEDLEKQDLEYSIRSMRIQDLQPLSTYTLIPEIEWSDNWILENSNGLSTDRNLVAGIDYQTERNYIVELACTDASGDFGASCFASFTIGELGGVYWDGDSVIAGVLGCPDTTDHSLVPGTNNINVLDDSNESLGQGIISIPVATIEIVGVQAQLSATLKIATNATGGFGSYKATCFVELSPPPFGAGPIVFDLSIEGSTGSSINSPNSFILPSGYSGSLQGSLTIQNTGLPLNTTPPAEEIYPELTFKVCKP
jgi:hypothetical protein